MKLWPPEGFGVKNNSVLYHFGVWRWCRISFVYKKLVSTVCLHFRLVSIILSPETHTSKNWNSGPRCPKILFFTILESGNKVEQVLFTKNWCQLFVYIFDSCQTQSNWKSRYKIWYIPIWARANLSIFGYKLGLDKKFDLRYQPAKTSKV